MTTDLTGQRFTRWTVLSPATGSHHNQRHWSCQCDCGVTRDVHHGNLTSGKSTSCGCRQRERAIEASTTHGRSRHHSSCSSYCLWAGMIQRCTNPNHTAYRNYGGRGVSVCERWRSYENFFADMGPRPDGMTLDRIDNELSYSPTNCRWATRGEQNSNKSNNRLLHHDGIQLSIAQWAARKNLRPYTLYSRLRRGWSPAEAIETPPGQPRLRSTNP